MNQIDIYDIKPKYGKYVILGNHEYYTGLNKSIKLLKNFGFQVSIDKYVTIDNNIKLTGLDEKNTMEKNTKNIELDLINKTSNNKKFTILFS